MNTYKLLTFVLILGFGLTACKTQKDVQSNTTQQSEKKNDNQGQDPDNSALYIEALKEKSLGNIDKALELFQACVDINSNDAASHYELAQIYNNKGDGTLATHHAEKAVELDNENPWYRLMLARLYRAMGRYSESVEQYEILTNKNPGNIDQLYELANAYLFTWENEKAISTYNKIEDIIGVNEQVIMQKQNLLMQMGKEDEAIEEVKKLTLNFPDETRYYAILAESYLNAGEDEKALETYDKILEIDPEDPYIHISLSDYYRKKGNKEKSYEELKAGFENPNLTIDTKVQILLAYYTVSDLYKDLKEQALELSEILIEAHPDDPKAYSIYADLLYQQDKFEKAREAFKKVLSLDSSKYIVWEQLLFINSELENYEAMLEESESALEFFPQQPLLYLFNGLANYQMNNYEECISSLERGINFVIENNQLMEQFYSYLGDAYHQLKDYENSDKYYEKALDLNPRNSIVLNNYAYYLSNREEQLEKAEEMAAKAVEIDSTNSANMDTYGWVLYKLKRYSEAKEWVGKAINHVGENNPTLLEHYGDILYRLGEKEEAIKYWKKAKEEGSESKTIDKKIQDEKIIE